MKRELKTEELRKLISGKSAEESLKVLTRLFPGEIVFTTSFGIEDQAIAHMIFSNDLPVELITLDTGRLFPETYKVFNETVKKYKKNITTYFPDYKEVEKLVTQKGPFSFYYSKENRIECCTIRKVVPLNRALQGKKCWISGIRAEQSDNRGHMSWLEYEEGKNIFKFYPIFNWSFDTLRKYIKDNKIPYNPLHDKGFVSIGCEPCTRAVKPGEDFRAGRWWWETGGAKECGCHVK